MKEREMVVTNKENKVAKEDKKLLGRKAYLLDKEKNIDKKEDMLHNKEKELLEKKEKNLNSEVRIKQLEKLPEGYKLKAQSKGRVVSDELKEKLRLYHANIDKRELE